ncbi:MAG TPA: FIST N-terminal domain-containing protein [Bradyrhizobium sp.]|nr:FIST N-terminal domain-containing protein [Bradyrhizobium sp.]
MRSQQITWNPQGGWNRIAGEPEKVSLVFYFGARETLACGKRYRELREIFPAAHILGCSTGGQINNSDVSDDEIVAAAISFHSTTLRLAHHDIVDARQSRHCGESIGRALKADDLAGVFLLSDGLNVNGSELVGGLVGAIGPGIPLTGGLAGDGAKFTETLVGGDCAPRPRLVVGIGFYGSAIKIGHGSAGGWDIFGPRRQVTRSAGNVLFELDGEPALDLYERYLGPKDSKDLPGSALLFPIEVHDPAQPDASVVRTVLAVDHESRSMTFAGDVPQGWTAQLMRGNFDRLAEGAADAARQARNGLKAGKADHQFSILVSCIGRRLLMGQRTSDETEAAGVELGADTLRLGFYSYGEISPHAKSGICELHNQTMTVTSFAEVEA